MFDDVRDALASVVGITVTPFDEGGGIDVRAYRSSVRRAARAGVATFTPNGNTSEFYSLEPDERALAVRLAVEEAPEAVVVAGVGLSVPAAISDGQEYARLGVGAVMVHQPVHPFWSASGWVDYHRAIAAALPEVAVIPYIRSSRVSATAVVELLESCPNVIGIKYAVADVARFASMVAEIGSERVTWVCGLAEMWAPFFAAAGAVGFTSGLVSVDPARSMRMLHHLREGDFAAAMVEWVQIKEFEELRARRESEMNVSVVKEVMAVLGLCRSDVRPPLSRLADADRSAVERIVREWGLHSDDTDLEEELR